MIEQITCAADLESLEKIRDFISDCCAKHDIPKGVVFELKLAVDEACTNVIVHGYKDLQPGTITLSFRVESDKILLDISDQGHYFDPSSAPPPELDTPLESRKLGGMGMYLIYKTMDKVEYESSEGQNTLTFIKYFNGANRS